MIPNMQIYFSYEIEGLSKIILNPLAFIKEKDIYFLIPKLKYFKSQSDALEDVVQTFYSGHVKDSDLEFKKALDMRNFDACIQIWKEIGDDATWAIIEEIEQRYQNKEIEFILEKIFPELKDKI